MVPCLCIILQEKGEKLLQFLRICGFCFLFGILLLAGPSFAMEGADLHMSAAKGGHAPLTFHVEIARAPAELAKGLMYRDHLPMDTGMLFIFEKDEVAHMWMRNTHIPLDMVFIDAAGTVVSVVANAKPMDETILSSQLPCRAALEINGGLAAQLGIKAGDKVDYNNLANALAP